MPGMDLCCQPELESASIGGKSGRGWNNQHKGCPSTMSNVRVLGVLVVLGRDCSLRGERKEDAKDPCT